MQEIWQHIFVNWIVGHKTYHAGPLHTLALARNACLINNMHLELAHIEQNKQIKPNSEYTSCNPEPTAAGILMPVTLDHIQLQLRKG